MTDKKNKATEEVVETEVKATEETTTEEVVEETKPGAISKSSAIQYKGKNPHKYEKPKAPKFTKNKARPEVAGKEGKKWTGTGLVDFETNGNMAPLGDEGTVWPTPAERAQHFVDSGHGKILGVNEEWKKKMMASKKGH